MSILECHDLTKRYGTLTALDHVNLNLEQGRIVGLLGPNGSGKTTMIKIACRLLQPSSGEILIGGEKPGVLTKNIVAYLPDREFLQDWMKVSEALSFYQDFFDDFDRTRAEGLLSDLSIDPKTSLKHLSKGNQEKVRLILTVSRNAKVFFLDEPIAGVDPAARDYILKTILSNYSQDALMVISTHLIADVESILDEAVFLKQGQVFLHKSTEQIREETGKSVDEYFRYMHVRKTSEI